MQENHSTHVFILARHSGFTSDPACVCWISFFFTLTMVQNSFKSIQQMLSNYIMIVKCKRRSFVRSFDVTKNPTHFKLPSLSFTAAQFLFTKNSKHLRDAELLSAGERETGGKRESTMFLKKKSFFLHCNEPTDCIMIWRTSSRSAKCNVLHSTSSFTLAFSYPYCDCRLLCLTCICSTRPVAEMLTTLLLASISYSLSVRLPQRAERTLAHANWIEMEAFHVFLTKPNCTWLHRVLLLSWKNGFCSCFAAYTHTRSSHICTSIAHTL